MLGSHLCNEDPDDDSELMQSSQRPADGCGGDFLHVNGHKAGGEARVKTHDEAANDEHLERRGQLGERHERNGKEGDGVGHEHGVLPSKTHIASSVFDSLFLESPAKKPVVDRSYLPKRLTKSPTEKEPHIPPTEKMATESDHSAVRVG